MVDSVSTQGGLGFVMMATCPLNMKPVIIRVNSKICLDIC